MLKLLLSGVIVLCLAGCTLSQAQQDCAAFHATEANPVAQGAITAGAVAATAASGVPVGMAVAGAKVAGDAYCQ